MFLAIFSSFDLKMQALFSMFLSKKSKLLNAFVAIASLLQSRQMLNVDTIKAFIEMEDIIFCFHERNHAIVCWIFFKYVIIKRKKERKRKN